MGLRVRDVTRTAKWKKGLQNQRRTKRYSLGHPQFVLSTWVAKGVELCKICKSKRRKFQNCSVIQQCNIVAIRKQYAMNYDLEKPGHGSTSCSKTSACTKCVDCHLTLLHVDSSNSNKQESRQMNATKGKGKPAILFQMSIRYQYHPLQCQLSDKSISECCTW